MKQENFSINSIENPININIKSIYHAKLGDNDSFNFKITNDLYYGYVVVVKGSMDLTSVDKQSYKVNEKHAIFVWTNDLSSYVVHGENPEYIWVWFSLKGMNIPLFEEFKSKFIDEDIEKFETCIRLLRKVNPVDLSRANLFFSSFVLDGIDELEKQGAAKNGKYKNIIIKAADYIRENICNLPQIEEIANKFDLSLKQFRKHFLKYMGVYPAKYIYNQKLMYAKEFLVNTNLNVNEVANLLNFSSAYYFSNCFKKYFGYSPREYIKKYTK